MIPLNPSDSQYKRMLETPIPRLITSLAVPTVISSLITVIYNTADTYFVSQIDKSASAAVGVVFSIMSIIQALGFGLGVGAGSLISRRLGAKDNDAANTYASSAFAASVVVGAILAIIVCHDAMGVRLETGKQAEVINDLIEVIDLLTTEDLPEVKLKEFVGHTPVQVIAGVIVGIIIGVVVVLGGGGFALYWFVLRKKPTTPIAPASTEAPEVEAPEVEAPETVSEDSVTDAPAETDSPNEGENQ